MICLFRVTWQWWSRQGLPSQAYQCLAYEHYIMLIVKSHWGKMKELANGVLQPVKESWFGVIFHESLVKCFLSNNRYRYEVGTFSQGMKSPLITQNRYVKLMLPVGEHSSLLLSVIILFEAGIECPVWTWNIIKFLKLLSLNWVIGTFYGLTVAAVLTIRYKCSRLVVGTCVSLHI